MLEFESEKLYIVLEWPFNIDPDARKFLSSYS